MSDHRVECNKANGRSVLIAGAGISGLATAAFLARTGLTVEVVESRSQINPEEGLFLNIAPNGRRVLETLGLGAALESHGFNCPSMAMMNQNGRRLAVVANRSNRNNALSGYVIPRGILTSALLEEVKRLGVTVSFGQRVKSVGRERGQKVEIALTDGERKQAELFIGADGIHSVARQAITSSNPKPAYTGLVSCGGYGCLPGANPTHGYQCFVFGHRGFFGYLIRPGGTVYWFSNFSYPGKPTRGELEGLGSAHWKKHLLDIHRKDFSLITDIIASTQSGIDCYPIYDMPSLVRWHSGNVVVIGDAAHATSPSAGQGASLALEDALLLAKFLRDIPKLSDALTGFEAARRERAERIVAFSRERGESKTVANPVLRLARDLALPMVLSFFARPAALGWIYDYEMDWNSRVSQAS